MLHVQGSLTSTLRTVLNNRSLLLFQRTQDTTFPMNEVPSDILDMYVNMCAQGKLGGRTVTQRPRKIFLDERWSLTGYVKLSAAKKATEIDDRATIRSLKGAAVLKRVGADEALRRSVPPFCVDRNDALT